MNQILMVRAKQRLKIQNCLLKNPDLALFITLNFSGCTRVPVLPTIQYSSLSQTQTNAHSPLRRKWSSLSVTLLELCKCFEKRLWPDAHPLRQFDAVISHELIGKVREGAHPSANKGRHAGAAEYIIDIGRL